MFFLVCHALPITSLNMTAEEQKLVKKWKKKEKYNVIVRKMFCREYCYRIANDDLQAPMFFIIVAR